MTTQEKIALIEDGLDLPGKLTPETVLADVPEYDSMAKLSVIVMFDDELGKKLTGEKLRTFKTVADILAAMDE